MSVNTGFMFQSAPAITGGRSRPIAQHELVPTRFNPRPPSLAGDPGLAIKQLLAYLVSIRARHHWRAIRLRCLGRHCCRWFQSAPAITGGRSRHAVVAVFARDSFNPRPPSLAGDPTALQFLFCGVIVSIRARHHWRAIR